MRSFRKRRFLLIRCVTVMCNRSCPDILGLCVWESITETQVKETESQRDMQGYMQLWRSPARHTFVPKNRFPILTKPKKSKGKLISSTSVSSRSLWKSADHRLSQDTGRNYRQVLDRLLSGSSIPLNQESFEELVRLANADDEINAQLDKDLKNKSGKEIAKKYRNPSPKMVERVSRRYERGNEGEEVKRLAGRKCQISEAMGLDPYSFQKKNGDNYCRRDHVVPVSTGKDGTLASQ